MVPVSTLTAMSANMLLGLLLPAAAYFMIRKRFGGCKKAFFTGCGIMFVFAFVLESAAHSLFLRGSMGNAIMGNIWLYGLYGGMMAALFEETGRMIAFRFFLKKQSDADGNAWMYGAGHGGFEAFYILFISGINNLTIAALINSGMIETLTSGLSGAALSSAEGVITQMQTMSWWMFLLAPLERIAAMLAHFSFSVFTWFAVKERKMKYYALALCIHFVLDFATVVLNGYLMVLGDMGTVLTEAVIWIMAGTFLTAAWKFYKNHRTDRMEKN